MGWTPEKVEKLRKLWKKGLTTVEIGRELGVSKNSVVGKAHRLKLDARPSPIKKAGEKKVENLTKPTVAKVEKKKVEKAPKQQAKLEKQEAPAVKTSQDTKKPDSDASDSMLRLMDVTATSCRWPIGDPKEGDFHFCDKEAVEGKPYCLVHCAQAYVGVNKFLKGLK